MSTFPPKKPGTTSTGARKASAKSARSRAREFALQALYQHLVGGNEAQAIDVFTRDLSGFHKADSIHYDALLHGCIRDAGELDALIALGCIIRGETYHFELVANESAAGVTRVSLDYQLPIANVILTTENLEQALARQTDKGRDAARVAVEMARLLGSANRP
jgi:hypothetical protein